VRDATGEADRVPPGGRAMSVLDVSGGERSSEIGMQHFEPRFLHDDAPPHTDHVPARSIVRVVGVCALVVRSEREFACHGF
jgi:hypothetical protein